LRKVRKRASGLQVVLAGIALDRRQFYRSETGHGRDPKASVRHTRVVIDQYVKNASASARTRKIPDSTPWRGQKLFAGR
jgi:hypothetical protein